jgi:hypothetical protein
MMGKFAWVKVVAENRHTIFKLVKEAFFGRKARPRNPKSEVAYDEAATQESQVSA